MGSMTREQVTRVGDEFTQMITMKLQSGEDLAIATPLSGFLTIGGGRLADSLVASIAAWSTKLIAEVKGEVRELPLIHHHPEYPIRQIKFEILRPAVALRAANISAKTRKVTDDRGSILSHSFIEAPLREILSQFGRRLCSRCQIPLSFTPISDSVRGFLSPLDSGVIAIGAPLPTTSAVSLADYLEYSAIERVIIDRRLISTTEIPQAISALSIRAATEHHLLSAVHSTIRIDREELEARAERIEKLVAELSTEQAQLCHFESRDSESASEILIDLVRRCSACRELVAAIEPDLRNWLLEESKVSELLKLPIERLVGWMVGQRDRGAIAGESLATIIKRLDLLLKAGLGARSIEESLDRLSEEERVVFEIAELLIRRVSQRIVTISYSMDNLAGRTKSDAIELLKELARNGNSVIVVTDDDEVQNAGDCNLKLDQSSDIRGSGTGSKVNQAERDRVLGSFSDQDPLVAPFKFWREIGKIYSESTIARRAGVTYKDLCFPIQRFGCRECLGIGWKADDMFRGWCEDCNGMRFVPEILALEFKGIYLGDLLRTAIDNLRSLFEGRIEIERGLKRLSNYGFGSVSLGSPIGLLSDHQRFALAGAASNERRAGGEGGNTN